MAMTVSYLRYLTQYLVGDPQMSTYSQQMYLDAINFACKEHAKKVGSTYVETAVTPDASGFVTIPTPYIRIQRLLFGGVLAGNPTTTKLQLIESTPQFEGMKSQTWESDTGTPKRWVQWSGAKLKLLPVPSLLYPATVGYVEAPTTLTSDSETIDARIPEAHHEFLKYAAGAWLFMIDGDNMDIQKSTHFMGLFNQLIGYQDPVLDQKLGTSRTHAAREI